MHAMIKNTAGREWSAERTCARVWICHALRKKEKNPFQEVQMILTCNCLASFRPCAQESCG